MPVDSTSAKPPLAKKVEKSTSIDQWVAGYTKAPKDKKDDLIVDYILGLLKGKKISPARIFSMADEYRKNKVKLGACLVALKKMLPELP